MLCLFIYLYYKIKAHKSIFKLNFNYLTQQNMSSFD